MLLGRYLARAPASLEFTYGPAGKPELGSDSALRFNLAHSGGIGAFAFATCEIGIDLEAVRSIETAAIVDRFFSTEERDDLQALPVAERELAFFRCWTRKEAFLKAVGTGLTTPIDHVRVTVKRSEPARILRVGGDTREALDWNLHDLPVGPDFAGALAYRGRPREIRFIDKVAAVELSELVP